MIGVYRPGSAGLGRAGVAVDASRQGSSQQRDADGAARARRASRVAGSMAGRRSSTTAAPVAGSVISSSAIPGADQATRAPGTAVVAPTAAAKRAGRPERRRIVGDQHPSDPEPVEQRPIRRLREPSCASSRSWFADARNAGSSISGWRPSSGSSRPLNDSIVPVVSALDRTTSPGDPIVPQRLERGPAIGRDGRLDRVARDA